MRWRSVEAKRAEHWTAPMRAVALKLEALGWRWVEHPGKPWEDYSVMWWSPQDIADHERRVGG